MDEACSHQAMHSEVINELNAVGEDLKSARTELEALEGKTEPNEDDYRRIADLKTAVLQKQNRFDELPHKGIRSSSRTMRSHG